MRRILLDDRDNQNRDRAEHLAIGSSEDDWIFSDGRGFLGTDGVSFGLRIPGELYGQGIMRQHVTCFQGKRSD